MTEIAVDYMKEYLDGLFASIRGFPAILYLDRQPPEAVTAPVAEEKRRKTVLYERAKREKAIKGTKQEKEIPRKKSARFMFFMCIGWNLAAVLFAFGLRSFVNFKETTWWKMLIIYFVNFICFVAFLSTRFFSNLWFGDVSKGAINYRASIGRGVPPALTSKVSDNMADFIFGIVLSTLVLIEGLLVYEIPNYYLSNVFGFIVMAQLNSFYSFEYMWIAQGLQTDRRVTRIEYRWPYHLGFGTLLTLATSYFDDFIYNSFIFAALFPFFIVSSCIASPPTEKVKRQSLPVFTLPQLITNRVLNFLIASGNRAR